MSFDRVVILIFLVYVFFKTASYGTWTWKQKNKLGGLMIYLLAAAAVILPLYSIYFRE